MSAPRAVVAMSGGVDSSVAAALLVEQGYDVTGMMLRLWSEPGTEDSNRCCTPDAMALARRAAGHLGIPFHVVDIREKFHQNIVQFFVEGYASGVTPNPCMNCNRTIRFGELLDRALAIGADFLATGHYARTRANPDGTISLLRAVDAGKDQSYVLSVLNQQKLRHALFPVGAYTKPEVRELARKFNLPASERLDSQDLCFLAGGDYRDFLSRHAPEVASRGPLVDTAGKVLGGHDGLAFYTIGQRRGLGIAAAEPLYVVDKDVERNALVVGTVAELGRNALEAGEANWISGAPPAAPFRAEVKIRYSARLAPGVITPREAGRFSVRFDEPLRDITPGQAAVIFAGEEVIGQGLIRQAAFVE
jgi:tRNA-specific 2-thiouridylase